MVTAPLDWSQCPAVESIPGKRSGAWVFKNTRMPVSTVFENLQDMSVDELVEEFGVTREQVQAVLQFAAHSAEAPAPRPSMLVLFENETGIPIPRGLAFVVNGCLPEENSPSRSRLRSEPRASASGIP